MAKVVITLLADNGSTVDDIDVDFDSMTEAEIFFEDLCEQIDEEFPDEEDEEDDEPVLPGEEGDTAAGY